MIPIHWTSSAPIPNLQYLLQQIADNGGSIIEYRNIFSVLIFSRTSSEYVWVPPYGSRRVEGLSRSALSLVLGWWSLPGLLLTPVVVLFNVLLGGADVTALLRYTYGSASSPSKVSPPSLHGGARSTPPPLPSGPPPLPGSVPKEMDAEEAQAVMLAMREAGKYRRCVFALFVFICLFFLLGSYYICSRDEKAANVIRDNVARATDLKLSLMKRQPDGSLVRVSGPVMPSLPCPLITVDNFTLSALRPADAKKNESFVVDVSVSGTVSSRLCDVIPGSDEVISEVSLFINGDEKPAIRAPLTIQKRAQDDLRRPFPFDGKFNLVLKALPVTEGNNVFEIAASQSAFHLDGRAVWAASFAFPDPDEPDAVKVPTISEQPRQLDGVPPGEGESELYCVATTASPEAISALVVSGEKAETFRFEPLSGADVRVAMWPETNSPAFFALRPTQSLRKFLPSDVLMLNKMRARIDHSSTTAKDRFLWGLGAGLAFEGYDLVFSHRLILIHGAQPAMDGEGLDIPFQVATTQGQVQQATLRMQPTVHVDDPSPLSVGDLTWRCANLYRRSDPKASDVALAMMTGDYSELGIEGHLDTWRSTYYMNLAESLERVQQQEAHHSEIDHGFVMGRLMADGMRVAMDPAETTMLKELRKSTFLTKLVRTRYFNNSRTR